MKSRTKMADILAELIEVSLLGMPREKHDPIREYMRVRSSLAIYLYCAGYPDG